jgi:hypothetical protein
MTESSSFGDYFVFVCVPERQAQYEKVFQSLPRKIVVVNDVLQLLSRCIEEPPRAVLLDAASSARIGAALVNPLLALQTTWPILRCSLRPDGVVYAMCATSDRRGTLNEALDAIIAGDPGWSPRWKRQDLRINVSCRARLRLEGEDRWRPGNCLDISRGGAFVVSYDSHAVGAPLEFELWDLLDEPTCMHGRVMRLRPWEESPKLPGVGLSLDPATVPADLSRVLAVTLFTSALGR